jgi:hypothetical protein
MFCRKCGTEIRLNAKFCHKCGAPAPVKPPEKSAEPFSTKPPKAAPVKPPEASSPKPVDTAPKAPPAPEEAPKLVIKMSETGNRGSNGQFDEWFSDPGNL